MYLLAFKTSNSHMSGPYYIEYRVEAPISDHLRDFAPDLENYKVVLLFPM